MNTLFTPELGAFMGSIIFGGVLTAFGALFLWIVLHTEKLAKESRFWTPIEGRIVYSEVKVTKRARKATKYKPKIRYKYVVDSREYESRQRTYSVENNSGGSSVREKRAYDIVNKYPLESTVVVYYNPKNPSQSILEPGECTRGRVFMKVFGGGVFAIGVILIGNTLRSLLNH